MDDQPKTPPQRLGIYVLQRAIGRGGMGSVFLAVDPTLRRYVALKVLAPELAADPDYVARFRREATSLARIRHPNLVHIYAVGEDGNRHFIAMEYLKGHTVAEILRQRGALPLPVAARILGQVLAALEKVHAAGIVHRDLKPANIMIDEDQRAILMDFGLAKPRHDHSVTTGNTLIGTPEYMAPEVAEGQDADFRSDVYALGVILFELLTGRVPFHGNSAIATLRQQVEQPTPSARSLTPTLPPQLDAVIARAMAKKPDERYPSVRAFAADLAALVPTPELTALAAGARAERGRAPSAASLAGYTGSPTTPTVPVDPNRTATVPGLAAEAAEPPTAPTMAHVSRLRRWRVATGALAAALLLVLALLVLPRVLRRRPVAVEPTPSAAVYVVHSRHHEPITGRLLTIGGAGGLVSVKAAAGVVEVPYVDVLKIELVAGR